jgi:hypothetical protein
MLLNNKQKTLCTDKIYKLCYKVYCNVIHSVQLSINTFLYTPLIFAESLSKHTVAKFLVTDWGDLVDSGIGLS